MMPNPKRLIFIFSAILFVGFFILLLYINFRYDKTNFVHNDNDKAVQPTIVVKTEELPVAKQEIIAPDISASAFISVYVAGDGREKILAEKNKDERLPLASITKLMTALVASEKYRAEDIVGISEYPAGIDGASGIYKADTRLFFKDALYALLIPSHNEIADALAEKYGKNKFIKAMNEKTPVLGLSDTKFFNASGLDPATSSNSINYSSAYDIYKLERYIEENRPDIFSITSKKEFLLSDAGGNFLAEIKNTNELLGQAGLTFRILGGKTGETELAKQNLVVVTESPCDGKIINVVLHSENRVNDMKKLLEYVNGSYEWRCNQIR